MSKTKHILVFRLSAMGDVAMTVPVLRALVTQYPEVKVTVVSRPFFEPFFSGISNVSFFGIDLKKRHKGFIGLIRLYADLRKLNINAFADLHNVLRSKIVRFLFIVTGKKVAATDKGRAEKKALIRAENKIFAPVTSMIERHVTTFQKLGFSINIEKPIFPSIALLSNEILKITGIKNEKWIGIAPFAQYATKVYPIDLMQEVIDGLAKEPIKIFLFGGGEEEIKKLNQLKKEYTNVIVVAGKVKFQQELDLISNLDVMLSMDSGNAHIAAMLGVKVITLWGATHPYAGFQPFHQPNDFCLTADREQYPLLPTSIYGNKQIPGYENVMRTILPTTVIEKIKESLS